MTHTCATTAQPDGSAPTLELRAPAESAQLGPLRGVSTALAGQCNMDLDQLADLRLAVDEACSTLLRIAVPDTVIVCRFRLSPDTFRFSAAVTATAAGADTPIESRFGWHVLRTLTDTLSVDRDHDHDGGEYVSVTISFTMCSGDAT
ncbi:ATP-binding protein [Prescottella subtropica]|uniref:ATP-binding protein n=1 Tax=Prescottella subtropica TaxID=2545757 RepID=UPI0010F6B981|nr:ATP-binding protein [Prescottella subtropica]